MKESKSNLQDIRIKQAEIEELTDKLNRITQEAYFYKENVMKEQEKLKGLKQEYIYRKDLSNKISNEIENLKFINDHDALKNVNEIKKKTIKQIISKDICNRVPQINRLYKGLPSDPKDSAYYQLVFDSAQFMIKNKTHSFKLMKSTTFLDIKHHICEIYKYEDVKEFVVTDYLEALILNEDQSIDEYLRHYSVFVSIFNIVPTEEYKRRMKISLIQEDRLKENVSLKNRHFQNLSHRKGQEVNTDYDIVEKKAIDFHCNYPLLKAFQKEDNKEKPIKKKLFNEEKAKMIETSFLMFIILILLYIFTLVSIYVDSDIGRQLITNNYLYSVFNNNMVYNPESLYKYLSVKIGFLLLSDNFQVRKNKTSKISDDYKNILNSITDNFYYSDSDFSKNVTKLKEDILPSFSLASNINFLVYKVKEKECDTSLLLDKTFSSTINLVNCYYAQFSEENKLNKPQKEVDFYIPEFSSITENISNQTNSNIYSNIDTKIGLLNANSHKASINPNTDSVIFAYDLIKMIPVNPNFQVYKTDKKYSNPDNDNNNYLLLENSTRAVQLIFTIYNSNQNIYYSININFYFLPTGSINPGKIIIKPAIYNIYLKSSSKLAADIIRFICISLLFCFMIYSTVLIAIANKEKGVLKHIFYKINYLNIIIIILFLVIIFLRIVNLNSKELVLDASYYILYDVAVDNLECVLLITLSIKLLSFLSLNEFIKMFYNTLFIYFKRSLYYLFFLSSIILLFSTISHILFSSYTEDSSSFRNSYLNLIMFTIGGPQLQKWIQADYFWSVLFIICYYSFLLFFSYIVFMSIFSESLRRLINKNGYPSDNVKQNWTTYDYLRWVVFCLHTEESRDDVK